MSSAPEQVAARAVAGTSAAPQLLRFATAGSVDDGKSTLIGRLLYDAKSLHADTIEAVESASRSRGDGTLDLALLTDGLRAEREQDELDVARGALICRAGEEPAGAREIDATLCWLGEATSGLRGRYLLKHTTSTVRAVLDTIHHTLEVEALTERGGADCLTRNEIGRVTLRTSDRLFFDRYADNRTTGSLILIDEATNETVGAGMIDGGR